MTTAEKREHFQKTAPNEFKLIQTLLDNGEYREVDKIVNTWNDYICISYVITWLCDELISKDRELNGHSVDSY